MMLTENIDNSKTIVNITKLISQLLNSKVLVEKLPSIKGQLRLITTHDDNENITKNDENDEFFFKEPGKKKASKVSKPFCSKCDTTIENYKTKDRHCLKCGTLLLFKCMTCRTQYTSYRGMSLHLKIKCDETTSYMQCSKCDYATSSRLALTKHKKYVHLESNIPNNIKSNFKTRSKYNKTLENPLELKEPIKCKDVNLKHASNKNKNLKSNFNDKSIGYTTTLFSLNKYLPFQRRNMFQLWCIKCSRAIKKKFNTKSHRCTNCKSKIYYKCRKCDKVYESQEGIKYHIQSKCYPEASYQCSQCKYTTTVKESIKKHIQSMHNRSCSKCNKIFLNYKSWDNHSKFCGVVPNLFCKLCSYKTKFKHNLKKHMFIHPEVNKNNIQLFLLNVYTEKKETKKPFTIEPATLLSCCSTCQEENDTIGNSNNCLKCGKRIYFKCKRCSKPCNTYYNASSHAVRCLFKNLTTCMFCDKQFKNFNSLRVHTNYCKKSFIECQCCDFKTKRKSSLKNHMKRRHFDHEQKNDKTKVDKKNTKNVKVISCCSTCKEKNDVTEKPNNKCLKCGSRVYFKCTKCNKLCKTYFNAMSHSTNCSLISHIMCPYCKRKMQNFKRLKGHIKYCNTTSFFQCPYCQYRAKLKSNLNIHMKCIHSNYEKKKNKVEQIQKKSTMKKESEMEVIEKVNETEIFERENLMEAIEKDNETKICVTENEIDIIQKENETEVLERESQIEVLEKENQIKVVENENYLNFIENDNEISAAKKNNQTELEKKIHQIEVVKEENKVEVVEKKNEIQVVHDTEEIENDYKVVTTHIFSDVCNISMIEKQKTYEPTIIEMCNKYCRRCKRLFKFDNRPIAFCNYCSVKIKLQFQCKKCGKRYNYLSSILHHFQTICFPVKLFICSNCNYSTHTKSSVINHIRNKSCLKVRVVEIKT